LALFGFGSGIANVINKLPLASSGFAWAVPALIGGILGNFVPSKIGSEITNA
jgi:LIVCS family branched-chain amino acid:cation transporter